MNKDTNCIKKLSCLHICACICVYMSVHVCMYTDPEVLQHECGDQRKMNLCLRFLFSSVSCKTRDSLSCFQFSFHNRSVRITDMILCMLWEWDLNVCPHALKINHLVNDSSPQQRLQLFVFDTLFLGYLSSLCDFYMHDYWYPAGFWFCITCSQFFLTAEWCKA